LRKYPKRVKFRRLHYQTQLSDSGQFELFDHHRCSIKFKTETIRKLITFYCGHVPLLQKFIRICVAEKRSHYMTIC